MIITHLAVSGVGRFRTRHVVTGLGPGLNLLCAPNEFGKSTLFRALQTALFSRHTSNSEDIRALASFGTQLPALVEVGFEQGGDTYQVTKSFVQGRASRFARNGSVIAEGRPADEAVWTLLGVAESGRSVDDSTFGLLWVRQGDSFGRIESSEGARLTLTRLIEAEVGQVLGGARGERVRAAVAARLEDEETAGGRPKAGGNWKRAVDAEEAARAELGLVRETLALLDADLRSLETKLARQRELQEPAQREQLRASFAAATEDLARAQRARDVAQAAAREAAALRPAHELAQRRHRELVEADARIAAARAQIAARACELATFDADHAAQAAVLAGREEEVAAAAAALAAADRSLDRLNKLTLAAASLPQQRELRERLGRARQLREVIAGMEATLAAEPLTAAQLRRLEEAEFALDRLRLQREAKAPQLRLQLGPDAGNRVRFGGEVADGPRHAVVTSPLRIEIENIARIEVLPVFAAEEAKALAAAEEAVARERGKAGVASLAEARDRRARSEALAQQREARLAELAVVAPAAKGEDGLALLEARLAGLMAPLERLPEQDRELAEQRPGEVEAARATAEAARDVARRRLEAAQAPVLAARSALAATDLKRATCRSELRSEEGRLAKDLAAYPDETRGGRLGELADAATKAETDMAAAETHARMLQSSVPSDEECGRLEARARRLREAIEGQEAELRRLHDDIIELRSRVAARGGEGLGEREAVLADALALAARERARIEERLEALRLLRRTIDDCRSEARDAYLAPIRRSIQPMLSTLFPGAEANMGDEFAIESLRRGGAEAEPFDSLSHGTREQIAVIVRLGLGRLLAARGRPAPVVLDDALVFSDDDRIEHMFDVLTQAAEHHQVIVLTCRSRLFQSFGGRRLDVIAEAAAPNP